MENDSRIIPTPVGGSMERRLAMSKPRTLVVLCFILFLCFATPLLELSRFAFQSTLFSHVLLIPFISGYLIWLQKGHTNPASAPVRAVALACLAAGLMVLTAYWVGSYSGLAAARDD